jgi:hypothetical protein
MRRAWSIEFRGATVLVDPHLPVAAVEREGQRTVVTWPDAPLPVIAGSAALVAAPDAAWIVYSPNDEDHEFVIGHPEDGSTAVCVGIDGGLAVVKIGGRVAVGADVIGLWTVEPTPAGNPSSHLAWEGEALLPPDPSEADLSAAPLEDWEDLPDIDAEPIDLNAIDWDAPGEFEEVISTDPTPPSLLVRFGRDGSRREVRVDREITAVREVEGELWLDYAPTGPRIDTTGRYHYPERTIRLGPESLVPESVNVADWVSTEVPEREWAAMLEEQGAKWADVDLSIEQGARWTVRSLDPALVERTVAWVQQQLEGLRGEHRVWVPGEGSWHRVRSDYRDLSVRVEGAWPELAVIADFAWRGWEGELVRFLVHPFDGAGRPNVLRALTTYLEEDLETSERTDHPLVEGRRLLHAHSHLDH